MPLGLMPRPQFSLERPFGGVLLELVAKATLKKPYASSHLRGFDLNTPDSLAFLEGNQVIGTMRASSPNDGPTLLLKRFLGLVFVSPASIVVAVHWRKNSMS